MEGGFVFVKKLENRITCSIRMLHLIWCQQFSKHVLNNWRDCRRATEIIKGLGRMHYGSGAQPTAQVHHLALGAPHWFRNLAVRKW